MMQVEYKIKIGQDEFTLKAEVKDEKEFFEQMCFYSNLPRTAPNGSDDLKLVFRTTKKGHKYYSLISETEKMEFKFGQNLEANGGGLFPKGWTTAYQNDTDSDEQEENQQQAQAAPAVKAKSGFSAPKPAAVKPSATAAPTQTTMPTPQAAVTPTPAATPAPAATAVNPQVTQVANNVLSRFGINK